MRRSLVALFVMVAASALAGDRARGRLDLDVLVPVPPYEHERLHFFGRDRHAVPGTVTINASPYACDVHTRDFRERGEFVSHLRRDHRVAPEALAGHLSVIRGRVHFLRD